MARKKLSRYHIYAASSLLHKETRRGDLASATYWAKYLSPMGEHRTTEYALGILFEETRAFALLRPLMSEEIEGKTAILLVTAARKTWEQAPALARYQQFLSAYSEAADERLAQTALTCGALMKQALHKRSISMAYRAAILGYNRCIWAEGTNRLEEAEENYGEMLGILLAEAGPYTVELAQYSEEYSHVLHIPLAMAELACGAWTKRSNQLIHGDPFREWKVDLRHRRKYPDYTFDIHTLRGKALLKRHPSYEAIRYGQSLPSGLDLRWSGQLIGVYWRHLAYSKFGMKYKEMPWEAVPAPSVKLWKCLMKSESDAYPALFSGQEAK